MCIRDRFYIRYRSHTTTRSGRLPVGGLDGLDRDLSDLSVRRVDGSVGYRQRNRVRYDTDEQKKKNRYQVYAISMFDTCKLSFSIGIKNTGMPGDGEQTTSDISMYRKFDISELLSMYRNFHRNFMHDISMYRNCRYDIQH